MSYYDSPLLTSDGIQHSMSFGELKRLYELGYQFFYEYVLCSEVFATNGLFLGEHEVTQYDQLSTSFVERMIEMHLPTDKKVQVMVDGEYEIVTILG